MGSREVKRNLKIVSASLNPAPQNAARTMTDKNARTVKMSRAEIIELIKPYGKNWKDEFVDVLRIPEFAYVSDETETNRSVLISDREKDLELVSAIKNAVSLSGSNFPKEIPNYGLVINGVGSYNYIILIDKENRVITRQMIWSMHSQNQTQDWQTIVNAINEAKEKAEKDPGKILVSGRLVEHSISI